MDPRCCHSLLRYQPSVVRHQSTCQGWICDSDRLHRWPPEPRSQLRRYRAAYHADFARVRQPFDFLDCAPAGILRQHHARQFPALQSRSHSGYTDHDVPCPESQAEQPRDFRTHAVGLPPSSSSPPSSVISLRKDMSLSARSGVIPGSWSTSSRSRSRMSWSVFLPACSSTAISSGESPFISLSATCVTDSSAGGSGANNGPSPPRSSHSRLEYRSTFQPVSSDASRTFWPFRPIASDSWSSSTIAWIVFDSGSENTRATRAGASDSLAKRSGSDDQGTMSIRSPFSSLTTACTRDPLSPTQAPTGSIPSSRDQTAILVRLPASRAVARISTICCWISGTSSLNSAFTNSGSARDRMSRGPLGVSSIRFKTARIVST